MFVFTLDGIEEVGNRLRMYLHGSAGESVPQQTPEPGCTLVKLAPVVLQPVCLPTCAQLMTGYTCALMTRVPTIIPSPPPKKKGKGEREIKEKRPKP